MQKYSNNAVDLNSRAINGATILVTTSLGAAATIYSDNGVTLKANPITTSQDGEYAFYAANGRYTVAISAPGFTGESVADILLYDPAEPYTPIDATIASSAASAFSSKTAAATSETNAASSAGAAATSASGAAGSATNAAASAAAALTIYGSTSAMNAAMAQAQSLFNRIYLGGF